MVVKLRLLCAAAAAAGLLSVSAPAVAGDTWTSPFPGVRHLYRTTSTPLRIHALVIDTCAPGVSFRATKSSEKGRTTSSFASATGVEMAVNGDFFSFDTYNPNGLAMGAGQQWGGTDNSGKGFVAFGPGLAYLSPSSSSEHSPGTEGPPPGATDIVSGRHALITDGVMLDLTDQCDTTNECDRHPRTGVGVSRDGRTFYLVTVDGRLANSIGIAERELAQIFLELGAYHAFNFDGGGSTTMWMRGEGVVNQPSGGTQRVVSNHLGIHADGYGIVPRSCREDPVDELVANAHELDSVGTTDVDGDGTADVCARAANGFRCHPSSGAGFSAEPWVIADLSDEAGFAEPSTYSTIRMGDVTGDGLADVCARGPDGVQCWPSTGTGFGAAIVGPELRDASGWNKPQYYTTLRLADVTGDGMADLCARAAAGLRCYPSTGEGFGDAIQLAELSNDAGWDQPERYGTLRMADIDGDRRTDVCGRSADGIRCWLAQDGGFSAAIEGPAWTDAKGWSALRYWGTIRLADIDGDRRADVCGRTSKEFRCHLSKGDSFASEAIIGPGLSNDSGWSDQANYLTLRMGDIDGDGKADVCIRGNAGVICFRSEGDGFGAAITGPTLSDETGWYAHRYFRTLRLADVDGDGKADLCARAAAGARCWASTGDGFGDTIAGPAWADASGWGHAPYYMTMRAATPAPLAPPIDDGGGDGGGGGNGGGGDAGIDDGDPDGDVGGGCAAGGSGAGAGGLLALAMIGVALGARRRRVRA